MSRRHSSHNQVLILLFDKEGPEMDGIMGRRYEEESFAGKGTVE